MKNSFLLRHGAMFAIALALSTGLQAQSVTTTTKEVTSEGTISSFEPQAFVIKSEAAPGPLTYSYSTTTRYVDDTGAVVTREAIRPGAPVTVYYTHDGERLVADRVIVHRTTTVAEPAPAAETTTTRTTTTTQDRPLTKEEAKRERKHEKEMRDHPERERRREEERGIAVPAPQTTVQTSTITSDGTIRSFAPDVFVVKTSTEEAPVTYRYTKTTEYVDDAGNPVTVETVKSGLPVTVQYVRDSDGLVASRVIVHRQAGTTTVRTLPPP